MIRSVKVSLLAACLGLLDASALPVHAADGGAPATLPSTEEMIKEQDLAEQKAQLEAVETKVIKPLLRLYGPDKYGIEAMYAKMLDLKRRSASGEDIALELARLKIDAERVNQQSLSEQQVAGQNQSVLAAQRQALADVENRWIAPGLKMYRPEEYRYGELYKRLQELKKRSANGEDIALELGQLKLDAEESGRAAWEDYKRKQGWK